MADLGVDDDDDENLILWLHNHLDLVCVMKSYWLE